MKLTDADKEDLIIEYTSRLEDSAVLLIALAKGKQTNGSSLVYVDEEGNDSVITVYDYTPYVFKSGDTLDRLAAEYLGSADFSSVIAYYNGIQNEAFLETGTTIKIPNLTPQSTNTDNKIYAKPEKQENYGVDISIKNGDFEVLGGDFKTVEHKENLAQAVENRLTTAFGRRIRLTSYGIRGSVGTVNAIESYLTGSIEQTVLADPRIKSVENIVYKGNGDRLVLSVSYTDINGERGVYKGGIL